MKSLQFRTLACILQVLTFTFLVNSAAISSTHNNIPGNYSEDSILAGYEPLIPDFLRSEVSTFNLIDPYIASEFITDIVVPPYLREIFTVFQNQNNVSTSGFFKHIDNGDCIAHILEWLERGSRSLDELANEENAWVLQMIDSWGKFPEGILSGHVNSMGEFHECVGMKARNINLLDGRYPNAPRDFEGRYCTVYIADYATAMPGTKVPPKNTTGRIFQENLGRSAGIDFNGRGAASLNEFVEVLAAQLGVQMTPSVGLCLPNSCTRGDIQQLLVNVLDVLYADLYKNSSRPHPTQLLWPYTFACYEEKKPDFDAGDISVMVILGVFGAYGIITGAIEYWLTHGVENPPQRGILYKYLMSFSVYTNVKIWASTKRVPGDFGCLHGLRFFSTAWIILAHTYYAVTFLPQWNMMDVKKVHEDWTVLTVLNSSFAVDTFFVIGGMLVSYNIIKMLDRSNGRLNIIVLYIKRYLRLTPTYAILVGIMATLIPYMGNGPYWAVMNNWGRVCEDNWWTNILYVNNLVNTSFLCQGETWYLANDMQFYILSPFIVYPLWKWEMIGAILLTIYTILSCLGPLLVVHFLDISPTLIPTRESQVGKSFTHLYIRPYARIAPYLVGIWLGWILYKTKGKKVKLPVILVIALWLASTAVALALIYAVFPWFDPTKDIPKGGALVYAALSRFAFGVVAAWIIFACVKGYGGIINSILSWDVFIPLARLCYCVYLVSLHLQMILHVRFTQPIKYDPYLQANFFLSHMVMSFLVGFVLWLFFESPFMILQKLIFDGDKKSSNSGRPPSDNIKRPSTRYGIFYNDIDTQLTENDKKGGETTIKVEE